MALEEGLADAQHLLALAVVASGALEQPATSLAADHVADVVAHDRRDSGDDDDELDFEFALAGQHAGGDERGLAGNEQPGRLGHHHQEQQRIADAAHVENRGERRGHADRAYFVFSDTSAFSALAVRCTSE